MTPAVLEHPRPTAIDPDAGPAANTPPATLADEALAVAARAGGHRGLAAFGELVDRYEGRLVSFIARRCGSHHDAEDLAQEAFLRAWSKLHTFDESRRFSVWLFTIAARTATSDWRKRQHAKRGEALLRPPMEADVPRLTKTDPDVWGIAERILDCETLSALWLQYAAGLEPAEIGRVLGRTGVGVRVLLHRARKKIAAEIASSTPATTAIIGASP